MYILRDDELCGALEHDLWVHCNGVELKWLFQKPAKITWRRVIIYIRHLPGESALARRGFAGDVNFSTEEKLTAEVINTLRIHNFMYLSAHSKEENGTPEFPELIELHPK